METKQKDDSLLRKFFNEQKQEIPDKGFTQQVMRQLPEKDLSWIVWLTAGLASAVTLFVGIETGFFAHWFNYLLKIPFYYLIVGIALFPLLSFVSIYFSRNRFFQLT